MQTVLVVEDDAAIAELYRIVFTRKQYRYELAVDGEDGLKKLKEIKPDIALIDIMMPKMNGMELLQKMKQDPELKDIPVFVLSNLTDVAMEERLLGSGAIKYVVKSQCLPGEIVTMVDEFFKTKSTSVA